MRMKRIIWVTLVAAPLTITAQVQNKVVVVESTFRPKVEQAEKLSLMPGLQDTSTVRPEIEYSVLPSRLETKYSLKPIKPAKLVGSSLDELYKSQIKLGIGNYTTPLVEFNIHNLRSKEYAIGAYVFHRSSHSKLELENNKKVPAGYSKNRVSLYGKRFYNDANLEGEVYLNTDKYRFYGYNTRLFPDTTLEAKDIRQYFTKVGAKVDIYSTLADSSKMQYRFGIRASHFTDDYKNKESQFTIPAQLAFSIRTFRVSLDPTYTLYAQDFGDTSRNKNVFQIKPMIQKRSNQWEVRLGLNTYFINNGGDGELNLFPEARLTFKVIDKLLQAYFGMNGGMEINNFSTVADENPFIKPGIIVKDTKNKLTGYGGIKGQLSSKSGYLLDISFSSLENIHFYVNDSLTELENQFNVVYDDMEQVKYRGELWYSPFTFLDFYLKGQYRSMTMTSEEKPWHVPAFSMAFTTRYNFKDKIFVSFDLINKGKRYAKDINNDGTPISLDPIWDLNLGVEYKYSDVLSAFVDFHNLLAKRYYIWNQYPSQKFNVMVGFSYKF